MSAADIIRAALDSGVDLTLTEAGAIKAAGDQDAINRLAPLIREHKPAIIEALKAASETVRSFWWRIHFAADSVDLFHRVPLTTDEARERYPAAIAAEAFKPKPAPPLSDADAHAIRAWLDAIGETDPDTIADVLTTCRYDPEARAYHLRRAREEH